MDVNGNQLLTRTTFDHIPVITTAGSITARLRGIGMVSGAPANRAEHACLVTVVHQYGSFCNIQLKQATTNVVGTGSNLTGQLAVVPGGMITTTIYPTLPHVDVVSLSGSGVVSIEIDSRIQWEKLAFSKTDAGVPPSLWKATNVTAQSDLPR